jgi:hypothetical protein
VATTYFETNTASDLNANTVSAPATSRKLLQAAPGSASSLTITTTSTTVVLCCFFTEPADPDTAGGSGSRSYTVKINVTTANLNQSAMTVQMNRVNSAGTVQTTGSLTGSLDPGTTGVKTTTFSTDLGTFAAGDRMRMDFRCASLSMSTQSSVIEVGLANGNEELTAPWTIGPVTRPPIQSRVVGQGVKRSLYWMKRYSGIVVPRLWTPRDA